MNGIELYNKLHSKNKNHQFIYFIIFPSKKPREKKKQHNNRQANLTQEQQNVKTITIDTRRTLRNPSNQSHLNKRAIINLVIPFYKLLQTCLCIYHLPSINCCSFKKNKTFPSLGFSLRPPRGQQNPSLRASDAARPPGRLADLAVGAQRLGATLEALAQLTHEHLRGGSQGEAGWFNGAFKRAPVSRW